MARIKFASDQVYETGGPGLGPKFSAGQVVDGAAVARILGMEKADEAFIAAWLQRWVSRGVAEYYVAKPAKAEPAAPPPAADGQA